MTLEEKLDKLVLDLIYTGSMLPKGKTIGTSMFPEHKQAILNLITEETAKARLDELKQLWNSTQPDLVPQGVKPNDMSDELHQRVNQLQAELKQSNNKDT